MNESMINESMAEGCVSFFKSKGLYAYARGNKVFLDVANEDGRYECSVQLTESDIEAFNSEYIEEGLANGTIEQC